MNKKIILPKNLWGIDGKEAYEKIMNEKELPPNENLKEPQSFNGDFIKSDYIQIPNQKFVIAIAETNTNLNYEDAHRAIIKKGLLIPTPNEFMIFHNYIIDCHKNKKQIFDAQANPISENTKNDLYKQLTQDCWIWLNGKFNISDSKKTIEYITGLDSKNNFITKTEPLEDCLIEDCYIDFKKLTNQGLARLKHSAQDFAKGENIYFWYPRNGNVARFFAYSGGPDLDCNRNPSDADSFLGVRAVWHK